MFTWKQFFINTSKKKYWINSEVDFSCKNSLPCGLQSCSSWCCIFKSRLAVSFRSKLSREKFPTQKRNVFLFSCSTHWSKSGCKKIVRRLAQQLQSTYSAGCQQHRNADSLAGFENYPNYRSFAEKSGLGFRNRRNLNWILNFRSWRRICGWNKNGMTTNFDGIRKNMVGWRCFMCHLSRFGYLMSCFLTTGWDRIIASWFAVYLTDKNLKRTVTMKWLWWPKPLSNTPAKCSGSHQRYTKVLVRWT